MSPMNHVGRRFLSPIFIPNSGHNQSASRIIALTFLTKNVSNESAFLVQIYPYRAFLRNHIRTNFGVPTIPTAPTVPTALTAPIAPIATTATTASTPSRGSTLLVLITNEQSKSRSQSLVIRSFGHSVDSGELLHSMLGLINCYVYYNTRAFIYQIVSQNLIKIKAVPIKAVLILSDITKVCDSTKLLENT